MKRSVAITLLSAILLSTYTAVPHQAAAATATAQTITKGHIVGGVNFRDQPSLSGKVIGFLNEGSEVTVLDQSNRYFYQVKTADGTVGYVSANDKYIQVETVVIAPSQPYLGWPATVVYGVNMRNEPSTAGDVLDMLSKGTQLTVLEQSNEYFYKVQTSAGQTGYVSTNEKYLQIDKVAPTPSQPTLGWPATVSYGVNMRDQPSTSGNVITMLRTGTSLTILEQSNEYFYKVQTADGTIGYVSTNEKYLEVNGQAEIPTPVPTPPPAPEPVPTPAPAPSNGINQQIEQVIEAGMKYLGTPYEFGSSRSNTSTFDCSDFVRQAYKDALGLTLPADSRQQGDYIKDNGTAVYSIDNLKRGDLVFFMSYKGSSAKSYAGIDKLSQRITHVAIYLGNGQLLHTYSTESGGVIVDQLDGSWVYRFMYGGSVLK
ncbi:cell wall hydrolase [Paenibacillus sp. J53TS2]|uniref:C40 family peptidase n=1 Tax=Paenibacillus sp. J53TS2 TaxID=2807197 RepID=UPI001B17CF7E|nr:SH3 domain-containing C40 family peptidase [Paenibacillus sp. J53TS2]GIP50158.1 cell wall hydrolase [Paenibacillus sp. J53TS2]